MTSVDAPAEEFVVCAEFNDREVVLAVRGELDLVTGPELSAVLTAVVDRGHRRVVVDLAECLFIDLSGLRAVAEVAARVDSLGGSLSIRSPSGVVDRLLSITGLADLAPDRTAALAPSHPAVEMAGPGPLGFAPVLRQLNAVLGHDNAVDGALRLVVALARAAVLGADGVSVSLRRHGQLSTVAASDATISDMDANQYATGEGPCVDASAEGRRFLAESLATETRWPSFTPRARELGINAILSSPLVVKDRPVGALNMYSRSGDAFAPDAQELASVFATEASTILSGIEDQTSAGQPAGRLADLLRSRHVIALAQGVTMEREGVDEDGAYSALRRFSVTTGTPLRQRAEDIVASTRSPRRQQASQGSEGTGA